MKVCARRHMTLPALPLRLISCRSGISEANILLFIAFFYPCRMGEDNSTVDNR